MYFFNMLLILCFYIFSDVYGQVIDSKTIDRIKSGTISNSEIKDLIQNRDILNGSSSVVNNDNSDRTANVENQVQEILKSNKSINDDNSSQLIKISEQNVDEKSMAELDDADKIDDAQYEEDISNGLVGDSFLRYFGYNVFATNPEIFEKATEFVDPYHVIGPGDEIVVLLWGEVELNNSFVVEKDGYVFIPNLGQVFVNGLNLVQLEKKLSALYAKVYSGLVPNLSGQASIYFDVSLGSLSFRPLRIFSLGELANPGSYLVSNSTTLFSSLYYFNGPTVNGSLRNIELIRDGKKIKSIDLYPYLLEGKEEGDVSLQRNDVVFIPPRGKTVTVVGEIRRPAIYEVIDEENLYELIQIAGGLLSTTYMKRVQVDRIIPFSEREERNMDRTIIDISLADILSNKDSFSLNDGDILTFFSISDAKSNFVTLNGPVNRPGLYDLGSGLVVRKLIENADGISGDAYLKRAEIIRQKQDLTTELIKFDLSDELNYDYDNGVRLKSGDVVNIFSKSRMKFYDNVSISGHVFFPGEKTYRSGMTFFDLIFLGGGFENTEHLVDCYMERAEITRFDDNLNEVVEFFRLDSVLAGKGAFANEVRMGDRIRIYSKDEIFGSNRRTVSISGFVKRPGIYPRYPGMRIKDLLFMSGGFQDSSHLNNAFMEKSDLYRLTEFGTREVINFNLKDILAGSDDSNFFLKDQDDIVIYNEDVNSFSHTLTINGDIKNSKVIDFRENMTIKDLVFLGGGPKLSRLTKNYKVEVVRLDERMGEKQNIANIYEFFFNVGDDLERESKNKISEFILKPNDEVYLRLSREKNTVPKVYISGEVRYPGDYVLQSASDRISDIIARAGGVLQSSNPDASKLKREGLEINISFNRLLKNSRSRSNIFLFDEDSIFIGKKTDMVIIEGEVNNPGVYKYTRGLSMKDYVELSGGYTRDASRFSSYVINPNGQTSRNSLFKFSPKISDGSRIVVGRKEDVEPFNFTEYVTDLTSIYADLSQAYLMILLASR